MYVSPVQRFMIRKPVKIAIYYGCADSYVGLAFTQFEDIVAYIKEHSRLTETDTEIGIR